MTAPSARRPGPFILLREYCDASMDTISPEKRSKVMSAIHSRDTLPEVCVRKMLWAKGWRFRVCDRRITGHPDIVVSRSRALIEVRGCFWHHHGWEWDGRKLVQTAVCAAATSPKSNRTFWNAKFRRNVRRDAEHERAWAEQGWNLIVVWECALKTEREREKTFAFILRNLEKWRVR